MPSYVNVTQSMQYSTDETTGFSSTKIGSGTTAIQVDGVDVINPNETAPVAVAGTLTTRTDDNTGVITITDHTFTDADTIAVFWAGGYRYDVTITAYDTNTISIDLGSGSNLPIATTAVTVSKKISHATAFNGTNMVAFNIGGNKACLFSVMDDTVTPVSVLAVETLDNAQYMWWTDMSTNPLTGHNITAIGIYNRDTAAVATVFGSVGYVNA